MPAYNILLKDVLATLAYVVETPSFAAIDPSMNLTLIKVALNDIQQILTLSASGSQ